MTKKHLAKYQAHKNTIFITFSLLALVAAYVSFLFISTSQAATTTKTTGKTKTAATCTKPSNDPFVTIPCDN